MGVGCTLPPKGYLDPTDAANCTALAKGGEGRGVGLRVFWLLLDLLYY